MSKIANKTLSYGKQSIDQSDLQAISEVLSSDWLTQGPKVGEFEDAFSSYTGSKYAVAVSNGTAALHLSLLAMGIGESDEVITSANTFLASANSVFYVGATPRLSDIDSNTLNTSLKHIEAQVTEKTKAIIPVHFAGLSCDMEPLYRWASSRGIKVIEDACHALGASYHSNKVGSCEFSDISTFSFHPVKPITTGEGGMITTNDLSLYEKLLMLRSHGVTKDPQKLSQNPGPWYYEMQELGYNYRMTDLQAALGVSQLKKLPQFIEKRREIANVYNDEFKNISWLSSQQGSQENSGYHLYVLKIDFDAIHKTRTEVMEYLLKQGVGTQVHYIPLYHQPYYKQKGYSFEGYPNCESYYQQALSIPIFPEMTTEDVEHVVESIKELSS